VTTQSFKLNISASVKKSKTNRNSTNSKTSKNITYSTTQLLTHSGFAFAMETSRTVDNIFSVTSKFKHHNEETVKLKIIYILSNQNQSQRIFEQLHHFSPSKQKLRPS